MLDMTSNPLVSVIIPTFNRANLVGEAIESVLTQTYTNTEIIIVDDGSTDGTKEVLEPYLERIVYLHQENQGPASARNLGIKKANGQYIAFLDSDDLWLPKKLELQVSYMEANPDVGMVHTGFMRQEEGPNESVLRESPYSKHWPSGYIFPQMVLYENCVFLPCVLARRECFDTVGLFEPELRWAEDYHMWLRIARHFRIGHIPQPLGIHRVHDTMITKDRFQAFLGAVRALERLLKSNPEIVDELGVSLVRRARFNRYFTLAYDLFDKGDGKAARPYFARCIRLHPSHLRSHRCYLASFLPPLCVNWMRQLKRTIFHVNSN